MRFASGKFVEVIHNRAGVSFLIQSTENFIGIKWEIKDRKTYKMRTSSGEELVLNASINYRLDGYGVVFLIYEREIIPIEYQLYQNYPNPFNPSTEIKYSLPVASNVTIKIYDILGEEITTLHNGSQEAGYYTLRWTPRNSGIDLSSGIYYYQLKCVDQQNPNRVYNETKKTMFYK